MYESEQPASEGRAGQQGAGLGLTVSRAPVMANCLLLTQLHQASQQQQGQNLEPTCGCPCNTKKSPLRYYTITRTQQFAYLLKLQCHHSTEQDSSGHCAKCAQTSCACRQLLTRSDVAHCEWMKRRHLKLKRLSAVFAFQLFQKRCCFSHVLGIC